VKELLYVGPGVGNWAESNALGVRWISSSPLAGTPTYPAFLDLAQVVQGTLSREQEWPLLDSAIGALAPSWEEMEAAGLAPGEPRVPTALELGASDEAPIVQHFLACALAQVLARMPASHGLLIRTAELWDMTSLEFLDRLVREPGRRAPIAIETGRRTVRSPVIASLVATAKAVEVPGKETRLRTHATWADRVLALCAHGLPVATLRTVAKEMPRGGERFAWPCGGEAYVLPAATASRLRRSVDPEERRRVHCAIFDSHPVSGWNYIRRSGHAIAARDADRLKAQHTACLAGLTNVGYDYLYRHLAAVAAAIPIREATGAHLGAARLAPRLWGRGGRRRAVYHYKTALVGLGDVADAVGVLHELANLYATTRTPVALKEARKWYASAFAALPRIADPDARREAEIRLRNGLALVDYHEGRDQAALDQEKQAMSLLAAGAPLSPRTLVWAEPLIRTNTAKLLIKRFGDSDSAIALLRTLLQNPDERVRRNCSQNLGRAYFDKRDYGAAVEHLASRLETVGGADLSELEELHDRFVFTLSLLALDDRERAAAQLPRMRYLASVNGTDAAQEAIGRLEQVCLPVRAAQIDLR
jgi:tetratricopeptide (TPR) repeat protein